MKASSYQQKRKRTHRADFYGRWDNGRQLMTERINGRTLNYNHKTGTWN